jgi:hypothetical protein
MKISNNFGSLIQKLASKGPVREGGRNPYVDWGMIIIVSLIVIVLLFTNSLFLFQRVKNGDIQSKEPSATAPTNSFDVVGLDNVINKFEAKADANDKIKTNYQSVPDPSI